MIGSIPVFKTIFTNIRKSHFFGNGLSDWSSIFPRLFSLVYKRVSSSRPSQLSSSLHRQVWSTVKRLYTISPKLLIMFDPHLGWCSSEIFKVATNVFYPHPWSNQQPLSISDDATTNRLQNFKGLYLLNLFIYYFTKFTSRDLPDFI